jgi:hypothetical protein
VPGPSNHDLPARIGPYRVLDRLGEGGMGTVYAGVDDSGRKVAIKVIRKDLAADPRYRARFDSEVAAAQRVRPFCTAPVLDADPRADPPYLVTEFVSGSSLQHVVAQGGPLRGADLEALAVGMASALTAIHDAGIVHRDLKPANVLLSPFGPRVIDFGIARTVDATRLTATGGIVGTPIYMAPEQLNGRDVTPASDVFAWGATVAFAARGAPCFSGNSMPAVLHRIISGEPDLSGLDGTLLAVVRAALAKDPADRPTAQQLLERLISSGPSSARRQTPPAHGTDGPAALVERQYRQAAEAGDKAAMYNLGVLLSWRGQAAEADYWYRRAAAAQSRYAPVTTHAYPVHPQPGHTHQVGRHNSAAVYALTFGLVGLITCGLPSIPAIVAGHIAWNQIRRTGQRGAGMAVTGIALGWVMLAFWLLVAIGMLVDDPATHGGT